MMTTMKKISDIYTQWESLMESYKDGFQVKPYYLSSLCPSNLYLGFDGAKQYVFIEFTPASISNFVTPRIKGLEIQVMDVPSISQDSKFIRISCPQEKGEVFCAFSNTLSQNLKVCSNYLSCADSLIETINYYRAFFANPKKPLSEEEERGLFAELLYLEHLISKNGLEVIKNWEGPSKNKRDFVFEDHSVEIKSTISQINPAIKISNELQLDPNYPESVHLFLKVYILEKVEEGDTVKAVANRILNQIEDIELKKNFLKKLLQHRFEPEFYENLNSYNVEKELFYEIRDDFPSLRRSNIVREVYNVQYALRVLDLDAWRIEDE